MAKKQIRHWYSVPFVVDRGFEPLCPAWEAGILALRWIHHCCIASAKVEIFFYSANFFTKKMQKSVKIFIPSKKKVENRWELGVLRGVVSTIKRL